MKVVLVSAVSLDGKIGRDSSDKLEWVSQENKRFFGQVSRKAGAVVLGHNTFKAIEQPLKERLVVVLASKPEEEESILGEVEFTNRSPEEVLSSLETRGFSEVVLGGGRKVNSSFLKENLIDEIWLIFEPIVLGKGINLFEEEVSLSRFKLLGMEKLESGLAVLKYGRG